MHRVPVLEANAQRQHDDKEDIDEADRVPDDEYAPISNTREREQKNRQDGDGDITRAGWHGKGKGQFAPAAKEEEVESDKPRQMQKHEPAQLDLHRPPLQRWNFPAREKSQGR